MRLFLLAPAFALAPIALAQAPEQSPSQSDRGRKCTVYVLGPLDAKKREELEKQDFGSLPQGCCVDSSDIAAEKKASDEHLRQMQRRGEVIPLQHQYEQELYYEDRTARQYEEACGKPPARTVDPNADPNVEWKFSKPTDWKPTDMTEMAKKACKAIGVVCKPVKHW
jgi:hypothetical protein